MQHLKPGKRVLKWTLELQEFEVEFKVDHSMKTLIVDVLIHKGQNIPTYPKREAKVCEEDKDLPNAHTLWFDEA